MSNIALVRALCALLDELLPDSAHRPHDRLIRFVKDRPGHDRRYAIDAGRIRTELGWTPREDFASGLRKTVRWYLDNAWWWRRILDGSYRLERVGLKEQEP